MTTWHLHPTYLRLTGHTYVRVLLIFNTTTRRLIAADLAEAKLDIEVLIRESVARDGLPTQARQLPNPVFADLEADIARLLAGHGFRHEVENASLDDDLVWVIETARDISNDVQRTKPATKPELVNALHVRLGPPSATVIP